MKGLRTTLVCLTVLAASAAMADTPPLTTDRPDQSDSPYIVPTGLFQIEAGFQHGQRSLSGEDLTVQSIPQSLFRMGVTESLEFRIAVPGYSVADGDSAGGSFADVFGAAGVSYRFPGWMR